MSLPTSYKNILAISTPIMLGSAAQNLITLTDGIFLGRVGEIELGAIGFVGVFYLIIASIGYGFSKGGQIIIARRDGEGNEKAVGSVFWSMMIFEIFLAIIMFLFMHFGAYYFFSIFVDSDAIFRKSLEYIEFRSYGVFFSYIGVAIIALYTGIARPAFIIYDTLVLGIVNIVLNYGLIFGKFGLPEMGIAGAGLASTIAEIAAFVFFIFYMVFFDKDLKKYKLFRLPKIVMEEVKSMLNLSLPIVVQFVVSLGSWFFFFSIVENLGEQQLAASNLVRMLYLTLSIPCWGFSSGINTIVSNCIGQHRRDAVIPVIKRTVIICASITGLLTAIMLSFPEQLLSLGTDDWEVIQTAEPTLKILAVILILFSIGSIIFNGIVGTGATVFGLQVQVIVTVFYLIYIYVVVKVLEGKLEVAWTAEIFYWIILILLSIWYLRSKKWHALKY